MRLFCFLQKQQHDFLYALIIECSHGEDFVQCVPTKKGHQILYKGYTYVFKCRLQCGSEQWICSYRQKTEEETLPEWVTIYFIKTSDTEHHCNICEVTIKSTEKKMELLEHVKTTHKEVYDLHKENADAGVGFRIEFLHLNVLKDNGDPKTQPIILGEMCETATEEVVSQSQERLVTEKPVELQLDVMPTMKRVIKRKKRTLSEACQQESRKRSWVWKYFDRMSSIIFRCNLCNVVLSIKGCNTNNMNRHIKSRHPTIYEEETKGKRPSISEQMDMTEVETPFAIKTEEICASDKDMDESFDSPSNPRNRRSWIWQYFNRLNSTMAQCKLCNRNISHGGNATGNMNRHLKMIHNKTAVVPPKEDNNWIWKVFDNDEEDFYSCKICQYRCMKFSDMERSINCIMNHLKLEHGVVSGDQIITGTDDCEDE